MQIITTEYPIENLTHVPIATGNIVETASNTNNVKQHPTITINTNTDTIRRESDPQEWPQHKNTSTLSNLTKQKKKTPRDITNKRTESRSSPWFCCITGGGDEKDDEGLQRSTSDQGSSKNLVPKEEKPKSKGRPSVGIAIELLKHPTGQTILTVYAVAPNGPAQRAGLRQGDILEGLNGMQLTCKQALNAALSKVAVDDIIRFHIVRNGEQHVIPVRVESAGEGPTWTPSVYPAGIKKISAGVRSGTTITVPLENSATHNADAAVLQSRLRTRTPDPEPIDEPAPNDSTTHSGAGSSDYDYEIQSPTRIEFESATASVGHSDTVSDTPVPIAYERPITPEKPQVLVVDMGPPLEAATFHLASQPRTNTRKSEAEEPQNARTPIINEMSKTPNSPRSALLALADKITTKKSDDRDSDSASGEEVEPQKKRKPKHTLGLEVRGQGGGVVVVHSVAPNGAAEKAGIEPEDVLETWDGVPLTSIELYGVRLKKAPIGTTITLGIRRAGNLLSLPLVVEAKARKSRRRQLDKMVVR